MNVSPATPALAAQTAREVASDFHPAMTAAYRLGAYSAQLGEICVPEQMFVFIHDQRDFCKGFASVAGATLTTVQFLGGLQ